MPMHLASKKGFTVIELLLVVSVIALLATFAFPAFGYLRQKAHDATCVSNLRVMHLGFVAYLDDHANCWPQAPKEVLEAEDETRYFRFWRDKMKDYKIIRRNWICPADTVNTEELHSSSEEFTGSYNVTEFDEFPNTAYNWRQPWIMERGEHHGRGVGPNAVMPDGTIFKAASILGN